MKYFAFEYTRDLRNDYSWKIKPDILSGNFSRVVQQFIYLRDQLRDDDCIDWSKIIFFLRYEDINIACQMLENGEDYVGRKIYSMRGCVSYSSDYRAILGVPDLVKYFFQNGSPNVEGDSDDNLCRNEYEICVEDEINPLTDYDETQLPFELNCNSFLALMRDICSKKFVYGAVVGPEAKKIFMHISNLQVGNSKVFTTYYDFNQAAAVTKYVPIEVPAVKLSGCDFEKNKLSNNQANLYLRVYRDGKFNGYYEWILQRLSDGLTIKSSKHHFNNRLDMRELLNEEQKILRYYSLIGFEIN